MRDQDIYNQAVLEIVENKENCLLNADDIRRVAALAKKFTVKGMRMQAVKHVVISSG